MIGWRSRELVTHRYNLPKPPLGATPTADIPYRMRTMRAGAVVSLRYAFYPIRAIAVDRLNSRAGRIALAWRAGGVSPLSSQSHRSPDRSLTLPAL